MMELWHWELSLTGEQGWFNTTHVVTWYWLQSNVNMEVKRKVTLGKWPPRVMEDEWNGTRPHMLHEYLSIVDLLPPPGTATNKKVELAKSNVLLAPCYSFLAFFSLLTAFFKKLILEREEGRERETLVCCSPYLCIHWLIFVCALTGDQTHNLGTSGQRSTQPSKQTS